MRLAWLFVLAVGCGFGDNGVHRTQTDQCGDGVTAPAEGCDDGNTTSGDGCSATCEVEAANPVCGNGIRETGEACDDHNTTSNDGCSATCVVESVCGNGVMENGEECDDHNTASGDGCSSVCKIETAAACTLIPQAGCSGGTPACDLTPADDGTTACRAVTKQGHSDSLCANETECRAGYTCIDGGATDWCMRFCAADSDCSSTGAGSRCVYTLTDNNGMSINVKVCSNSCNVYTQAGCPTGLGCLGHESSTGDWSDCDIMGSKPDGATCTASTECLPGSLCATSNGVSKCHSYCQVGLAGSCASPQQCVAFTTPLNIGTVQYGACL